jgi:hypothetical protein
MMTSAFRNMPPHCKQVLHGRTIPRAFVKEVEPTLEELLLVLADLAVSTAGIEFDPDGAGEYVCFRDPDNIQVEFYVGDYHD